MQHQARRRQRAQGGIAAVAAAAAEDADLLPMEDELPLQAEMNALAQFEEGELDRSTVERGTAPALTPAAAAPLGGDPFGVFGPDAFAGTARSRERDWNTLPTLGAPSLAGGTCAACGF